MFRFMQGSQWYSRLRMDSLGLLFVVILLIAAMAWYYHTDVTGVSPLPAAPAQIALKNSSTPQPEELVQREENRDPLPKLPAAAPRTEPRESVSSLEFRYYNTRATADRIELAGEIASWNDSEAVQAIGRLFRAEHHPAIKLALLGGLNDISSATALDARLDVLTFALHGQPRDVRTAALDSLAQIDDPRIAPLLKKVMTTDPDHEVREIASALYEAVRP